MVRLNSDAPPAADAPMERRVGRRFDLLVLGGYLLAAAGFAGRLLADPSRGPLHGVTDHLQFQYFLTHAARVVANGEHPFVTTRLNSPNGVNLLANTSVLGLGLPLSPVTLAFGAAVTYVVALVLGLAGTAFGWYWVFSRRLPVPRLAAVVGGLFCAFAPGMVAHAHGHLNWTTQVLVPFIVDRLFQARHSARPVRDGLILAALASYQAFINEEVLLFTALGTAAFGVFYALTRWAEVRAQLRPFFTCLAVAIGAAGVVLAYPLYIQFAGPYAYHGLPVGANNGNDLLSFTAFSRHSVAGDPEAAAPLTMGPSEENSFLGWPLVVVLVALTVWLWRNALARAAAVTVVLFAVLSLGIELKVGGQLTGVRAPWSLAATLPLLDSVIPTRLALVMVPAAGLLLTLGLGRISGSLRKHSVRRVGMAVVAAALVAAAPIPLSTRDWPPPPEFITAGHWRSYVPDGRTAWIVNSGRPLDIVPMQWSTATGLDLRLVGGYFLYPGGNGIGYFGPRPRPTSQLIAAASASNQVPVGTPAQRAQAMEDIRYWRASVILRPTRTGTDGAVHQTLVALYGPPDAQAGDVWVWDFRPPPAISGKRAGVR